MKYIAASAILVATLAAATAFDGTRWWSYVQFLASDDLKGRDTGSEGHKKAVQYVAAQFERDGLKPAGEQGYIQPVRFISKSLDESKSSVVLVKNGKDTPIKLGDEAIIGTRVDPAASVVASNRSQPTMHLAAPGMYESEGLQLGLTWNPAKADMLLAGTGHTFNELVDLAEAGKPQPHFALNARLKVKTAVKHSELESQNVAAIFPGTDPKLKDEYVVLSGHVDHVGDSGAAINGDHIFNGAMDDAAGTAVILDIAAHLKETGAKPKRSILLVVVTAEEKGLLGSKYFAAHPTVNGKNIVADVNCDMFLPLYPLKILTVYGLDESTLGDDLRTVAAGMGVKVQPDPAPIRNVFIRSDQYNFILNGVPSVMAAFGSEKGSKEDEIEKEWLKNRYHAPSDDLNQPVDKAAAGKYVEMMEKLLLRVANADRKPEWKPESFFKRYASN